MAFLLSTTEARRRVFYAGLLSSCLALTGCMGSPTIQYAAPPSANPANSATLVGTKVARNTFNDSYGCALRIDGVGVADDRHMFCKYLSDQRFLVPPGRHKITVAISVESGNTTMGRGQLVDVELQAGKTYTVRQDVVSEDTIRYWLADESGAQLGATAEFKLPQRTPAQDTVLNGGLDHPPEKHKVFVYADFGERNRPFENAFTQTFASLAASCRVETGFLLVPHAVGLTLEPPRPPSKAEVLAEAAAFGPDGVLHIKATGWFGNYVPANAAAPLNSGRLTLAVGLAAAVEGRDEWNATMTQRISDDTGGDQLAQAIVRQLAKQGGFPHCPDSVLR